MSDQMLIKNLPDDIRNLANINCLNLGRTDSGWLDSAFPWSATTEGYTFWKLCDAGLFDKARLLISTNCAQRGQEFSTEPVNEIEIPVLGAL